MGGIFEYIAVEWQRSPNPDWYKALGLLLLIGGVGWVLWMLVDTIQRLRRLRKLERIHTELMDEYDAMIKRRNGAA